MKKLIYLFLIACLALFTLTAGGNKESAEAKPAKAPSIGLVLSTGGLGDKNFNDMAYEGLQKAQETLGITFDYVEPKSPSDFLPQNRMFAEAGTYDLIIALGNDQLEALKEIAKDFPNQKISFIDSSAVIEGVRSVSTKWPEQTFLCGVVAGLGTLSTMDKAKQGEYRRSHPRHGLPQPSRRCGRFYRRSQIRQSRLRCLAGYRRCLQRSRQRKRNRPFHVQPWCRFHPAHCRSLGSWSFQCCQAGQSLCIRCRRQSKPSRA